MMVSRLVAGVIVLSSIACSKSNLIHERQRTNAPANKADVGVILEGAQADEVEALLGRHPAGQVRLLNAQHGMYELFGVSQEEAQAHIQGKAATNSFFELHSVETRKQILALMSVPGPKGLKIGSLNPCAAGAETPTAKLEALEPSTLSNTTLEIGKAIKVSGANSTPGPNGKALKTVILIAGPSASANRELLVEQNEFSFTPDALGLYQIYLVVQDQTDVCAMDGMRFLITANRPYNGPKADVLNVDLSKLSHLGQVDAEGAWRSTQGAGIVIAVIDTGINYNHPALAPAILINQKEIDGNGLDEDGNGFADDVLGYDFVNGDAFPYDDDSHGTHVAGLAAGRPFGLARKAQILPIKALTSVGGDVGSIAAAIRYAVDRGAKIINMSLGTSAPIAHPALASAVDYAESKGVLIVAAAGNGDPSTGLGYSIDDIPSFPASLPNDNILSVASFDSANALSVYSNFGKISVDVVAPGGLAPTDPMISAAFENPRGGLFVGMTGTSMAAPVVSGIAAQVWSLAPNLSVAQVKEIMMQAGPEVPELKPVTVSGRHLNAHGAVELAMQHAVLF